MRNLMPGIWLPSFLLLLISTGLSYGQRPLSYDDEFTRDVKTLSQADMLKRAAEDPQYAQWLKTTAWAGAKIKAGDLALAKKIMDDMPKDVLVTIEVEQAINKLALSGNPQVILLLEDYLKSDFQREAGKWLNAERIISKLVYYSPELTNFAKLPRVPNQPFFLQPNFLNERAMPRSAWIRWFDANKERLIAKNYSEVELFSHYQPLYKEGVEKMTFDVYSDDGYQPNSAPVDIENKLKREKEQLSNAKQNNEPAQSKPSATQTPFVWIAAGLVGASVMLFAVLRLKRKT